MSFYSAISRPSPVLRTTSNTSFLSPLSFGDRYDRLGSGQDLDLFGISVCRSSIKSQMLFVRKVYLTTLVQFLAVLILTTTFNRVSSISQWLEQSKYAWWIVLFPATVLMLVVAWQLWIQYYQLSKVSRIVMLSLYSIFMAFILSDIISKMFHDYGVLVILMSFFGIIGSLLYTFQVRFSFTGTKPCACSVAAVCFSSLGLRGIFEFNAVEILGPIALSSVICIYITLDLYYLMDMITLDDYVLANLSLHIDVAYPINCLHHICELSDTTDSFPELFDPSLASRQEHMFF